MSSKYDKSYVDHLCDYESAWRMLFTFSVGMLGLMLLWLVTVERGTATFAVTVLNVAGLSALSLLSGALLWRCR